MAYRVTFRHGGESGLGTLGYLIITNLVLYVATFISPRLFIGLFGFQPASFLGHPWTILTSLFIHDGIWHILGNMLTLYFFGSYLISLVGERRFLVVYFLGGILGNVVFMWLGSPLSTAIGASGAVFAVAGALAVMRPKSTVFILPIPVPVPLWVAVLGGFLIISPGIAWQAHLGGLVVGLISGFLFRRQVGRFF